MHVNMVVSSTPFLWGPIPTLLSSPRTDKTSRCRILSPRSHPVFPLWLLPLPLKPINACRHFEFKKMSGTRSPTQFITNPKIHSFVQFSLSFLRSFLLIFLSCLLLFAYQKDVGMLSLLSLDQFPVLVHLLWRAGVTNQLPLSFGSESHSLVTVSVHFHPFLSSSYLSYI